MPAKATAKDERDQQAFATRLTSPTPSIKGGQPVLAGHSVASAKAQVLRAQVKKRHGDPKVNWKPNQVLDELLANT